MRMVDLIRRQSPPAPWSEGDNIPWNDPDFSVRMLREHLSQSHDAASRRFEKIDKHVTWIHETLLHGKATKILDLACGPGLYSNRLAKLGHTCTGIDFSPASIRYATQTAERDSLSCTFIEQDIRKAEYGSGYGLAFFIFGEFNVFKPTDARDILVKALNALTPGGILLLEPHTFSAVQKIGQEPPTWQMLPSGLFSDRPHLYLEEHFWDEASCTMTTRYFVIDAASGEVRRYAHTFQAYTDNEYGWLLLDCGFKKPRLYSTLGNIEEDDQFGLMAVTAVKE